MRSSGVSSRCACRRRSRRPGGREMEEVRSCRTLITLESGPESRGMHEDRRSRKAGRVSGRHRALLRARRRAPARLARRPSGYREFAPRAVERIQSHPRAPVHRVHPHRCRGRARGPRRRRRDVRIRALATPRGARTGRTQARRNSPPCAAASSSPASCVRGRDIACSPRYDCGRFVWKMRLARYAERVNANTCELLCLDLPKAESTRSRLPSESTLQTSALAARALGDPTGLAIAVALREAGNGVHLRYSPGSSGATEEARYRTTYRALRAGALAEFSTRQGEDGDLRADRARSPILLGAITLATA